MAKNELKKLGQMIAQAITQALNGGDEDEDEKKTKKTKQTKRTRRSQRRPRNFVSVSSIGNAGVEFPPEMVQAIRDGYRARRDGEEMPDDYVSCIAAIKVWAKLDDDEIREALHEAIDAAKIVRKEDNAGWEFVDMPDFAAHVQLALWQRVYGK